MVMRLSSFIKKQRKHKQLYHHHQQQQYIMQYLLDNNNSNYTDPDFSIIRHNQFLDRQDKFPDFDLRELSFDCYSRPPRIIKGKEVISWTPTYKNVITNTSVLDRNRELTVQTEDGRCKGGDLDCLLWINHFSPSSPVDHMIKRCTVSSKNVEFSVG